MYLFWISFCVCTLSTTHSTRFSIHFACKCSSLLNEKKKSHLFEWPQLCVNGALKIKFSTTPNRFVKMQFAIYKIDNEQNNPRTNTHTHRGKNANSIGNNYKTITVEFEFEFANLRSRSRSRSFSIYNNVSLCVHVRAFSELYYTNVSMFWWTFFSLSLSLSRIFVRFFLLLVVIFSFSCVDLNCLVQSGEAFQSNSPVNPSLYYIWCIVCHCTLCIFIMAIHSHITCPIH